MLGLGELDVIAFDFANKIAYLCEVTTHLDGLQIGGNAEVTIAKLNDKHRRQREYAARYLKDFSPHYMFWSPVVRPGLVPNLNVLAGVELWINEKYTSAIEELLELARHSTADMNNPAFRVLQILGHLKRTSN